MNIPRRFMPACGIAGPLLLLMIGFGFGALAMVALTQAV